MKLWIIGLLALFTFFAAAEDGENVSVQRELAQDEPVLLAMNKEKQDDKDDTSASNNGFAFRSFQFLKDHSVEVGVELPLNLGVHGSILLTDTTYIRLGGGYVYEKFLGVFSAVAPRFGYITKAQADLMVDVLKSSLYLDGRIGWRPYAKSREGGPYIELGISSMLFGKGKTDAATVRKALDVGDDINDIEAHFSVKSNVYNATFHLGYQIPFAKNLRLNVDAGIMKIFHAQPVKLSSVELERLPQKLEQLPQDKYNKLSKLLVEKGWVFPTVSVWISFMF